MNWRDKPVRFYVPPPPDYFWQEMAQLFKPPYGPLRPTEANNLAERLQAEFERAEAGYLAPFEADDDHLDRIACIAREVGRLTK